MNALRTQGAILCVAGVLKLTLRTPIVITTLKVTRIIVKRRYGKRERLKGFIKEFYWLIYFEGECQLLKR